MTSEEEPEIAAGHRIARCCGDGLPLVRHVDYLYVARRVDGFPEGNESARVGVEQRTNAGGPQLREHRAGGRSSIDFGLSLCQGVVRFRCRRLLRRCTCDLPHSQCNARRRGGGEKISPRRLWGAAPQCLSCVTSTL